MKRLVYLCAVLFSLLLFSFCYSMFDEPKLEDRVLTFGREGGRQQAQMKIRKYMWRFVGIVDVQDPSYVSIPYNSPLIEFYTLPNGREEIRYEWARFIISQDRRSIEVILAPNDTGQERKLLFEFSGKKPASGNALEVIQKA